MYRSFLLFLLIAVIVSSCSRTKKDPCENQEPKSSINATSDMLVCFESVDSYDLDFTGKKRLVINGKLFFPDAKKNTYDAIIMTHGSGGKRRYHDKYVDLLTEMGLVVFQLDHYAARKIKYDKTFSKVSGLTFMNDAYAALDILKTDEKINNVGYLGWSQGGVGPILSHFKFVND